jgi:hypothetical protein
MLAEHALTSHVCVCYLQEGTWRWLYTIQTPGDCESTRTFVAGNPAKFRDFTCCNTNDCTKPDLVAEPFLRLSPYFAELL